MVITAEHLREGDEVVIGSGQRARAYDIFIGHRFVHFMTAFGSQRVPRDGQIEVVHE